VGKNTAFKAGTKILNIYPGGLNLKMIKYLDDISLDIISKIINRL
jgi:hypothetical protein